MLRTTIGYHLARRIACSRSSVVPGSASGRGRRGGSAAGPRHRTAPFCAAIRRPPRGCSSGRNRSGVRRRGACRAARRSGLRSSRRVAWRRRSRSRPGGRSGAPARLASPCAGRARARAPRTDRAKSHLSTRRRSSMAMPVLDREDDDYGKCRAWLLRGQPRLERGPGGERRRSPREAAECADRAEDERELFEVIGCARRWRRSARRRSMRRSAVARSFAMCARARWPWHRPQPVGPVARHGG